MAPTLKLEIVTPAGSVYSEDVEMVTLPGVAGQMGVYPQHVPLITQMVPGEMIVRKDGRDLFIATGEGLIEITAHRVAILTDLAIQADRIDEAKAEKRGSAPKPVSAKSCPPKKSRPSTRRSRARWPSCASSDAVESDPCAKRLAPARPLASRHRRRQWTRAHAPKIGLRVQPLGTSRPSRSRSVRELLLPTPVESDA
jgi:F-type H+-transporting ATPase subunit epsilon